ncbi:MAG: ribonuclease HII [Hymenobacter sp.]
MAGLRVILSPRCYKKAVILPPDFTPFLNDSKQLTARRRVALRAAICAEAVAWAVGEASVAEIEAINIAQASYLAMHRAVTALAVLAAHLLVDGNRFRPYPGLPHACAVGGDGRYRHIAAASILAKTFRDEHMARLADEFPAYGWAQNAGYPHHRMSFRLL